MPDKSQSNLPCEYDYIYEREIHEIDEEELSFPEDNFDLEGR
jgi:hypothetical protein